MNRDVVSLTETLVESDSAPGCSTDPVAGLVAEALTLVGAHVTLQRGLYEGVSQRNVVARFGGDASAGLILAGHLDTVPWAEGTKATTSPLREGTVLYGRGTCDMKGAVAAQIEAAASMADKLARPLVLVYTYAEEVGCHGAVDLVADASLLGDVQEACCIVGEPTDMTPITGHKGYGTATIQFKGCAAHSSDPWAGADASQVLGVFLERIHRLREDLQEEGKDSGHQPPGTTFNTGLIRAGTAANVIPEKAELVLEVRRLPETSVEEIRKRVEACLKEACESVKGVEGHIFWHEEQPPFAQPEGDRLVEWLTKKTGQKTGRVPFYTEAEIYRTGFVVPTVVCGPGSIAKAHREDESVTFEELEGGVALYAEAIAAFCG